MTNDDVPGALHTRRRPLLRAATATVLGAGVMAGAGAGVLRTLDSGDSGRRGGRLILQADAVSGVGLLERPLHELGLVATGPGAWATPALSTSLVTMVGFTWRPSSRVPRIEVRFRSKGGWTAWQPAALLHDLPDPDTDEGGGRMGTSPLLVEPSDGLQVRVTRGLPRGLRLTLIHAARLAGDERLAVGPSARTDVSAPVIHSRAEWGANESWRNGAPRYNSTILQAHIHHTATSNGYAQADVPAAIRSMYRYHTHSLGWSDIAYNFLVDSYGTIWEGRYGGVDQPVRGAHTLGFNNTSTGFSVIGNLDTVAPTTATLQSLTQLAAWKLAAYGRDPQGSTLVTSEGSDKYPAGRTVTLPVIDGHRDTNDTACPGANLYAQLETVRSGTAGVIAAGVVKLKKPFQVEGDPVLGKTLSVVDGRFKPSDTTVTYQWVRNTYPIEGATGASYQVTEADVGLALGVVVTGSRSGAPPVTQGVTLPGPCRSVPTLTVRTQRRPGGKAVVHLDVVAPGVAAPDGQVLIKVGSRQRTVAVKKGKAIARILGLPPGRYRVRCQYAGGQLVEPGRVRDWVRIPGKGKG